MQANVFLKWVLWKLMWISFQFWKVWHIVNWNKALEKKTKNKKTTGWHCLQVSLKDPAFAGGEGWVLEGCCPWIWTQPQYICLWKQQATSTMELPVYFHVLSVRSTPSGRSCCCGDFLETLVWVTVWWTKFQSERISSKREAVGISTPEKDCTPLLYTPLYQFVEVQ